MVAPQFVCLTPTQRAAMEFYDMGFSIGPTKPASKEPYLWRRLVQTRIERDYLQRLFDNRAGIFVIVGRISRNLTVLDCETEREADYHAREFERRGLKVWRVTTARGGHLWWLSADGELANVRKDKFPNGRAELWGNTHYCLCPPSVHPTGVIYDWEFRDGELPPSIPIAALDWLPVELRFKVRRKVERREADPLDCLSKSSRDFIAHGATSGDRNNRLFKAACDMAGNEFDYQAAYAMLAPVAQRCGLESRAIRDTIKSAFSKPRTPSKQSRPTPPLPTWMRAAQWAERHQWRRMNAVVERVSRKTRQPIKARYAVTAETARKVFNACCERARRDNGDVFRASTREVAELANMGRDTAYNALRCLIHAGVLVPCGRSDMQAGLYAFGKVVAGT